MLLTIFFTSYDNENIEKIIKAYYILINPNLRSEYNKYLNNEVNWSNSNFDKKNVKKIYEDFKIKYNNKKEDEIFKNLINQPIKINPLNEKQNLITLSDSKNINGKKYEKTIIQIREENGNRINQLIEFIDGKVIYSIIYNNGNRINSNELNRGNIYKNKIREIKNYAIE